ncbi:hypothetical protein OPT61_g9326 [Boeremia exigua]|uniref:Uncharacterized protein n=1 Tax=Boeremia exigua TaxID=749465 RepID=A0ACC2HUJ3_9PLEO|nr:hypothetical protein OPT61_g9326 [Boeremia exigua]
MTNRSPLSNHDSIATERPDRAPCMLQISIEIHENTIGSKVAQFSPDRDVVVIIEAPRHLFRDAEQRGRPHKPPHIALGHGQPVRAASDFGRHTGDAASSDEHHRLVPLLVVKCSSYFDLETSELWPTEAVASQMQGAELLWSG